MRRRRFGSRYGRSTKPTTRTSTGIQQRRGRCQGCKQMIEKGDQFTRIRLRKDLAVPCSSCGAQPKRSKRFHMACVPADHEKAMGYDPNHHGPTAAPPVTPNHHHGPTAAPPPRPKSSKELRVESILMLEAALAAGLRDRTTARTPELEKALGQIKNLKERIVRPGTEGEGEAATNVTLKKLIDAVFGGRA